MSERFDSLFSGLSEADAITTLRTNPADLPNPGVKYLAASRLGAASSGESLAALMLMVSMNPDNLIDRITKRKSIEALGRRKSTESVSLLIDTLSCDDEPTVVNAVDAIARIRPTLTTTDIEALLKVALGPDNQKRAVLQAFTRLELLDTTGTLQQLVCSPNPMVASAAHAYSLKNSVSPSSFDFLSDLLRSSTPGHRRAAVIDIGATGDPRALPLLASCPVSMPLRAKSAFQIVSASTELHQRDSTRLLQAILEDDPRIHSKDLLPTVSSTESQISAALQHRDEAIQYSGALALMKLPEPEQISLISAIKSQLGSDYGVHYLLTLIVGRLHLHQLAPLVNESLEEEGPQYAKSRVAAAWSCYALNLLDTLPTLQHLAVSSPWRPLAWSCQTVVRDWTLRHSAPS